MKPLIAGLFAAILVIGAAPVRADTVAISGVLDWDSDFGRSAGEVMLTGGPFGTGAVGPHGTDGANFVANMNQWTGPYPSGEQVTLAPDLTNFVFTGGSADRFKFAHVYPASNVTTTGELRFTSSSVTVPTTLYQVPFTVAGWLKVTSNGTSLFDGSITGAGRVSGQFEPGPAATTFVNSAYWQFTGQAESPTPEPASLLLLGAGLFGAAVIRRRRLAL